MEAIFIDSGALVAVLSDRDEHHAGASVTFSDLLGKRAQLVTTNHVVDECCNWFLRKALDGHASAMRFGRFIREKSVPIVPTHSPVRVPADRGILLLYSIPEIEDLAWKIFAKYDTAGFSFTDCVSFAVMQMLGITKAFTFDEHYEVMGFERLG